MRSEIINIKTDPATKKQAKKLAEKLGFSLSSILNAYMRDFIKTKTLTFSAENEEPSEWLINELKQGEQEEKEGFISPAFDNVEDSIAWLHDPNARYQNDRKVQE